PSVQEERFRREYGLVRIGPAKPVRGEFYAISVERRIKHPAISAVVNNSRRTEPGGSFSPSSDNSPGAAQLASCSVCARPSCPTRYAQSPVCFLWQRRSTCQRAPDRCHSGPVGGRTGACSLTPPSARSSS